MGLTPEEIRARVLSLQNDRKPIPLEFPAWGDDLYIRVISGKDQEELEAVPEAESRKIVYRIILHCLVNVDGERIFGDDDEEALREFPAPELMQVYVKIGKVNGLTSKEIEEAVENFVHAPDEFSSSG